MKRSLKYVIFVFIICLLAYGSDKISILKDCPYQVVVHSEVKNKLIFSADNAYFWLNNNWKLLSEPYGIMKGQKINFGEKEDTTGLTPQDFHADLTDQQTGNVWHIYYRLKNLGSYDKFDKTKAKQMLFAGLNPCSEFFKWKKEPNSNNYWCYGIAVVPEKSNIPSNIDFQCVNLDKCKNTPYNKYWLGLMINQNMGTKKNFA